MSNFLIHTSINARRYIMDHLKERLQQLEGRGGSISLKTPGHDHSKNWILESISEGGVPDVMLSHGSDFSVMDEVGWDRLSSHSGWAGNPSLHRDSTPFHDPEGKLHPIFVVPMVPVYNLNLVKADELTGSWSDLMNKNFKVLFPDKDTPISKAVMAYLKRTWPEEYPSFRKALSFGGSPVEVIQAVGSGQFHMGISNVSFSMMAKQRNVEIDPPSEGAIPVPQVLAWNDQASPELSVIHELLMEEDLQRYLEGQGFWAVADIPEDGRFPVPRWKSPWSGWEDFFSGLRDLEREELSNA
ncbi:ABC transporter substrate-binding protein [Dethiosulfovibrio salsuginis]|uniref:Extracellular solute-binding protein n=1 Tax=Dethiosulfovibrio salsuginis TaxID=561720 RepID=A0A1X7KPK2_9BACT|nr:ABC transporter substrate-binding protein [Dethiosulfovibrio salsuginis]SMG43313.1 extracellular solute-binding protein [Dethiosulfovibrio salsuginis]